MLACVLTFEPKPQKNTTQTLIAKYNYSFPKINVYTKLLLIGVLSSTIHNRKIRLLEHISNQRFLWINVSIRETAHLLLP